MAHISLFTLTHGLNEVALKLDAPESARIRLYFGESGECIVGLSVAEAVKLRDGLSAAILEAATAAAKAEA